MTTKILEYLGAAGTWSSTLDIAKEVLGRKARCKDINPLLYPLERQGRIELNEEDGEPPQWRLAECQDELALEDKDLKKYGLMKIRRKWVEKVRPCKILMMYLLRPSASKGTLL